MRRSKFSSRLQPSLLEDPKGGRIGRMALNQLINVAVAGKDLSALRTQEYFAERARRSNRKETLRILDQAGKGNPPVTGDELPAGKGQPAPERKPARKTVSRSSAIGKHREKRTRRS